MVGKVKKSNLPATDSDGAPMVNAGRYARHAVLGVFEQIGGEDAMAAWARQNPDDFYTKLFPKIITREVEQTNKDATVDDLIAELDSRMVMVEASGGDAASDEDDHDHDTPVPAFQRAGLEELEVVEDVEDEFYE